MSYWKINKMPIFISHQTNLNHSKSIWIKVNTMHQDSLLYSNNKISSFQKWNKTTWFMNNWYWTEIKGCKITFFDFPLLDWSSIKFFYLGRYLTNKPKIFGTIFIRTFLLHFQFKGGRETRKQITLTICAQKKSQTLTQLIIMRIHVNFTLFTQTIIIPFRFIF